MHLFIVFIVSQFIIVSSRFRLVYPHLTYIYVV